MSRDIITLTDQWERQQAARAVPGSYYSRDAGAWVLEDPTPRAAAVALKLFPELIRTHPELLEIREALAQDVRPIDYASDYAKPIAAPRLRTRLEELG